MTPISEPGIYPPDVIDIEDYHSQRCCAGPSVSSSSLRTILRSCPALFWAFSDLNPDRIVKPTKESFDFGRAAHALVLGEPEFNAKFVVSQYDNFRTKDSQIWREEQTRQVVRKEDMPVIEMMARAQRDAPQVARAFTAGKPEMSVIWKDEETGVFVKTRPDWLPDFPAVRFITEYKTCLTIEPRQLSIDAFRYGYEMQAAMSLDAIEIVTGKPPLGIAHICQEKAAPYLCDMRLFTAEQIGFGRNEYRRALRIFARCLDSGKWPAYTAEPQFFDTPAWITRMMENFDEYDPSQI